MKHTFLTNRGAVLPKFLGVICLCLFLICIAGPAGALELEISGGANLFTFQHDKTLAYSSPMSANKEFEPYLYIFGDIKLKNNISESMFYNIRISRDNILRNSLEAGISAKTDHFSFEFGPFIGLIDKLEKPFLGIQVSIDFTYPGVFFMSLSASSTFGTQFGFTSGHTRETAEAKIGFWLPIVIPSLNANIKSFTQEIDSNSHIRDSLTRIFISVDFYSKRIPVTFRLDAGYQILSRHYNIYTVEYTDELKSFFAGFELAWQLRNQTKITLGAELPVSFTATAPLLTPVFYRMPKVTAGFAYVF